MSLIRTLAVRLLTAYIESKLRLTPNTPGITPPALLPAWGPQRPALAQGQDLPRRTAAATTAVQRQRWPHPSSDALDEFYGDPRGWGGEADNDWELASLGRIAVPPGLNMVLSWDTTCPVHTILCHHKVAASLTRILQRCAADPQAAAAVRLYGGCYNYRPNRGNGAVLSLHAYGAAIDIDPAHNPYHSTAGSMPLSVIQAFEDEGWLWGGRFIHGRDPMHFQATGPYS